MYHPNLFSKYHKNDVSKVFTEAWECAVRGQDSVTINYEKEADANKAIQEMKDLKLTRTSVRMQHHKASKPSYNAEGFFDTQDLTFVSKEFIKALNRRVNRVEKYGLNSDDEMMYRMADELHTSIQIAVNEGKHCVCVYNPVKDKFDAPFPSQLDKKFKQFLSGLNANVRFKTFEFHSYLWTEEGILIWNWDGFHPDLKEDELEPWMKRALRNGESVVIPDARTNP